MKLFDKKFVHFMWDDELKGKKVFVSDYIDNLHTCVDEGYECDLHEVVKSADASMPFQVQDDLNFTFAYYDPNYEVKKAFNEGKEIQFKDDVIGEWCSAYNPRWDLNIEYRVKPEEEKWIAYLVRSEDGNGRYLTACIEDRWESVQKQYHAKTKLFVGTESEVEGWYSSRQKFAEVIKAWEDGKEIQIKNGGSHWDDINEPGWGLKNEYHVKPEEENVTPTWTNVENCKKCVHVVKSAMQEPCNKCFKMSMFERKEKHYRPYESSAEMIADFTDRFKVKCPSYCEPLIWVKIKSDDVRFLLIGFGKKVSVDGVSYSLNELLKYYVYLDGSPCGMEVKE